eukprot:1356835-Amorphochlora_amoeboformis.AAC.1
MDTSTPHVAVVFALTALALPPPIPREEDHTSVDLNYPKSCKRPASRTHESTRQLPVGPPTEEMHRVPEWVWRWMGWGLGLILGGFGRGGSVRAKELKFLKTSTQS